MKDVITSEWVKFRSLRSMGWTMVAVVALMVILGALFSFSRGHTFRISDPADRVGFDPTQTSLSGLIMAQVAVAVLGVRMITSEFGTGTIRSSLTVVPRRGRLLAAKAVTVAGVAFAVGVVAALAAFLLGQPILGHQGAPHTGLGDAGVARAVFGSGLYLAAIALFGLALGAIVRSTAGTVTLAIMLLLMTPVFASLFPPETAQWISKWWPSVAGLRVAAAVPDRTLLGPWQGFTVLALFAGVFLAAAFAVFTRRDT